MVTFTTELLRLGNNVGIEVPEDIVLGFGVAGGETHDVTLTHDASSRETPVPDTLAEALAAADRREAFDALAPSKRKEHVRQETLTSAKAEEIRDRRTEKIVDSLE